MAFWQKLLLACREYALHQCLRRLHELYLDLLTCFAGAAKSCRSLKYYFLVAQTTL